MTVQFPEVSNSNVCQGHKSGTKDFGLMKQVDTVFYFLPHLCKADNAHYNCTRLEISSAHSKISEKGSLTTFWLHLIVQL